jgi:hypothetical protein
MPGVAAQDGVNLALAAKKKEDLVAFHLHDFDASPPGLDIPPW